MAAFYCLRHVPSQTDLTVISVNQVAQRFDRSIAKKLHRVGCLSAADLKSLEAKDAVVLLQQNRLPALQPCALCTGPGRSRRSQASAVRNSVSTAWWFWRIALDTWPMRLTT